MIFNNLKNRSFKIDLLPDSHKIDLDIQNTEEAFNLFDEVLIYKTASIFDYINSIEEAKFKELIKRIINPTIMIGKKDNLFNRKAFYEDLHSIQFKNKQKEVYLELRLSNVFEILLESKGIIKIETVINKQNNNTIFFNIIIELLYLYCILYILLFIPLIKNI